MTCSPDTLLNAAAQIAAIAKDEGMYRASVSRAYYASYHRCRGYYLKLGQLGTVGKASGVHEQLVAQLAAPSRKLTANARARSVAIGKYLRAIYDARVRADYHMDTSLTQQDMESALQTARTIFAET